MSRNGWWCVQVVVTGIANLRVIARRLRHRVIMITARVAMTMGIGAVLIPLAIHPIEWDVTGKELGAGC